LRIYINFYADIENSRDLLNIYSCNDLSSSSRILRIKQLFNSQVFRQPSMTCDLLMIGHYLGAVGVTSFLPGDMPLISLISIISTGICMLLVDRIGRKKMLLTGMCFMSLIYILLFTCLLWMEIWDISIGLLLITSIALVLAYVIAFSCSLGTIPWFLVCELSSSETRAETTAFAFSCYWITHWCFQIFLWICKDIINAYILLVFSFLTILLGIYLHRKLPETQGETMEEFSTKRQSYITTTNVTSS